MTQGFYEIISNVSIAKDIYEMVLGGDTSAITRAGQFVNIKLDGLFLRRPISVCDVDEQNLTIITNSVRILEKLRGQHIRCYLTGGSPVQNSYALVGSLAEQTISGFNANICFFSSQGISKDGTISDQSERETALRKLMIRNSKIQYFLFDGSKYDKHLAFRLGPVQNITGFITDLTVEFPTENL